MKRRASNRGRKIQILAEGSRTLNPPLAQTYEKAADVFDQLQAESDTSSKHADEKVSQTRKAFESLNPDS